MDGLTFGRSPRILIVEPNPGSAEIIVEVLEAVGCAILGPCLSLREAERLLDQGCHIDGAVLEMAVQGCFTFDLATRLIEDRKAVVFFSRCGAQLLPNRLRAAPVLPKPQGIDWLARVAIETFFKP
jgi:CheY-like chemotaxis protein